MNVKFNCNAISHSWLGASHGYILNFWSRSATVDRSSIWSISWIDNRFFLLVGENLFPNHGVIKKQQLA